MYYRCKEFVYKYIYIIFNQCKLITANTQCTFYRFCTIYFYLYIQLLFGTFLFCFANQRTSTIIYNISTWLLHIITECTLKSISTFHLHPLHGIYNEYKSLSCSLILFIQLEDNIFVSL